MDEIRKSQEALKARDYKSSLQLASAAIEKLPKSYKAYLQKSTALHRLGDHENALSFAEQAVSLAKSAGVREDVGQGHFRRAVAYASMKQFAEAKASLKLVEEYNYKDPSVDIWKSIIDRNLKDDIAAENTTQSNTSGSADKGFSKAPGPLAPTKLPTTSNPASAPAAPAYPSPDNVRCDFFQSSSVCEAAVFIKNAPKESTKVEFDSSSAKISFTADGTDYSYTIGPFAGYIVPEESKFRVFGTKIELVVRKADSSKWEKLLADSAPALPQAKPKLEEVRSALATSDISADASKLGYVPSFAKDWSKVVDSELDEKDDDDADPDKFFRDLYKDADEDTRRAMMKSFVESNGTNLSTNWEDVQKGPVPVSPPTDMEPKSWS